MFVEKSIVSKRFLSSFDNIKLYCTKKGEGTSCFPHLLGYLLPRLLPELLRLLPELLRLLLELLRVDELLFELFRLDELLTLVPLLRLLLFSFLVVVAPLLLSLLGVRVFLSTLSLLLFVLVARRTVLVRLSFLVGTL